MNQRLLRELKLVNYTRCKTYPLDALEDGGPRTNHSDSGLGGSRIYNHGQESGDKFKLLAFVRTHQTRIQPHLPNLALHPSYNVENYQQFRLILNIVLGGEGKSNAFLKRKQRFFETSVLKLTIR